MCHSWEINSIRICSRISIYEVFGVIFLSKQVSFFLIYFRIFCLIGSFLACEIIEI